MSVPLCWKTSLVMGCDVQFFNPWSLKNIKTPGTGDSDPTWKLSNFKGFHAKKFGSQQKKATHFFTTPHGGLLPAPHWHKNFQPHRVRSGPLHPKASGRMLHGHAWHTWIHGNFHRFSPMEKKREKSYFITGFLKGFPWLFCRSLFFQASLKMYGKDSEKL